MPTNSILLLHVMNAISSVFIINLLMIGNNMKKYKFSLIFTGLLIFGHILVAADESKPVVQTPYAQLKGTPNKGVILTKPEKDSEYSYPSEKYREIYQELLQRPYNFQEECSADLIPIFNAFSETTNILAIIPTGRNNKSCFKNILKNQLKTSTWLTIHIEKTPSFLLKNAPNVTCNGMQIRILVPRKQFCKIFWPMDQNKVTLMSASMLQEIAFGNWNF